MMLSDGRPVPVTPAAWASEMRRMMLVLGARPGFADVADLRKLLAFRPDHYLGLGWETLVGRGRDWLVVQEKALPPLVLPADLMGVLADTPALVATPATTRIMGAE
jgi:hypothetical protein